MNADVKPEFKYLRLSACICDFFFFFVNGHNMFTTDNADLTDDIAN